MILHHISAQICKFCGHHRSAFADWHPPSIKLLNVRLTAPSPSSATARPHSDGMCGNYERTRRFMMGPSFPSSVGRLLQSVGEIVQHFLPVLQGAHSECLGRCSVSHYGDGGPDQSLCPRDHYPVVLILPLLLPDTSVQPASPPKTRAASQSRAVGSVHYLTGLVGQILRRSL